MALKSPLMPSPTGGLSSAYSPYNDSPNSPASHHGAFKNPHRSSRNSTQSDSLAPPSPYPQHVDPSPVDSNGTEGTEIDDDAQDEDTRSPAVGAYSDSAVPSPSVQSPGIDITSPDSSAGDRPQKLITSLPLDRLADTTDESPPSVIHAPPGFQDLAYRSEQTSPTNRSENTVVSPNSLDTASWSDRHPLSPARVITDVPRYTDRATPRAQTRQELEEEWKGKSRRTPSLEDIPEAHDKDDNDSVRTPGKTKPLKDGELSLGETTNASEDPEEDVVALRNALAECWSLCNTLSSLSFAHRQRKSKYGGRQDVQEQAWRSCWRLCQKLYETRDDDVTSHTIPVLELCREFCQALFDARHKQDEEADSVLRVSFELNNHLFNTQDRILPEAFNERTLDFYVTLCHRLMKQRTTLPQETDALLRACWFLAEMLFNIRQNRREGKSSNEDILSLAVQACWELCDLFREGWNQVRPDRGTPRPTHSSFSYRTSSSRSDGRSSSSRDQGKFISDQAPPPETPTTIFDDMTSAASSPDTASAPNILVLGPAIPSSTSSGSVRGTNRDRWTSNASVLSGYSESATSQRSSSTATVSSEEAHLIRLRYLLLKVGIDTGFIRTAGQQLPTYVKGLPENAFGSQSWQRKVLSYYRKLVTNDKSMVNAHTLPPRRLGASEMAKAVDWLGSSEQWAWMRDLYRIVFGFGIDEAERRGGGFLV